MANIKLVFQGTERSETHTTELQAYFNTFNEIYIEIYDSESVYETIQHICLDKPTAVRLVRELKKQIGYLNE